jgi:hypothetical protein
MPVAYLDRDDANRHGVLLVVALFPSHVRLGRRRVQKSEVTASCRRRRLSLADAAEVRRRAPVRFVQGQLGFRLKTSFMLDWPFRLIPVPEKPIRPSPAIWH